MTQSKYTQHLKNLGKGILVGVGIGASLFGIFMLSHSFYNQEQFSWSSFIVVLSGCFCIYLGLANSSEESANEI